VMTRRDVALPHAYRLLNHGPTVLVSAAHAGRANVMAAAWAMPLDFDPPKVTVVIDKSSFTRRLIEASGAFALSVPCRALADATYAAGSLSGAGHADKLADCGLRGFAAQRIEAPLIEGCIAWLECRVIDGPHERHHQQAYDLFVAEVLAAQAQSISQAVAACIQCSAQHVHHGSSGSHSSSSSGGGCAPIALGPIIS